MNGIAAGSLLLFAVGVVIVLIYAAAPIMLYGIFSRLGRLIEIQEHISGQLAALHLAVHEKAGTPAQIPAPQFRSIS
jgi:hypothetical protein